MASNLKKIFLSASIPLADRDPKYFDTADNTAIRDAVIALARIVLPKAELVWGGHPSITPLIKLVLEKQNLKVEDHVTLYQSKFFPPKNKYMEKVIRTDTLEDRTSSLKLMREEMIVKNDFCAAIFIGGMEGVEDEYKLFKEAHPDVPVFPIASTGAASRILYFKDNFTNERLLTDFCYLPLFDELFEGILGGE